MRESKVGGGRKREEGCEEWSRKKEGRRSTKVMGQHNRRIGSDERSGYCLWVVNGKRSSQ